MSYSFLEDVKFAMSMNQNGLYFSENAERQFYQEE